MSRLLILMTILAGCHSSSATEKRDTAMETSDGLTIAQSEERLTADELSPACLRLAPKSAESCLSDLIFTCQVSVRGIISIGPSACTYEGATQRLYELLCSKRTKVKEEDFQTIRCTSEKAVVSRP